MVILHSLKNQSVKTTHLNYNLKQNAINLQMNLICNLSIEQASNGVLWSPHCECCVSSVWSSQRLQCGGQGTQRQQINNHKHYNFNRAAAIKFNSFYYVLQWS